MASPSRDDLFKALDDFCASMDRQRDAEEKAKEKAEAEAARKAPRIIASYLTDAGKALADRSLCVTVTETGPRDDDGWAATTVSACQGCPEALTVQWQTETYSYSSQLIRHTVTEAAEFAEREARTWAQSHAETCRALPKPVSS